MKRQKRIAIVKKTAVIMVFWGLLLTATALPLRADIYRGVDENGVVHFTNTPTSSRYRPLAWIKLDLNRSTNEDRRFGSHSPDLYNSIIEKASLEHGVDAPLVKAIIKAESNFNPRAVSRAGAQGLMQIMPMNCSALQITDPFDPEQNIMGGTLYFKQLLKRFDGNVPYALAAYNAGPSSVDRFNRIPPIRETEEFVQKVMGYYDAFKRSENM